MGVNLKTRMFLFIPQKRTFLEIWGFTPTAAAECWEGLNRKQTGTQTGTRPAKLLQTGAKVLSFSELQQTAAGKPSASLDGRPSLASPQPIFSPTAPTFFPLPSFLGSALGVYVKTIACIHVYRERKLVNIR